MTNRVHCGMVVTNRNPSHARQASLSGLLFQRMSDLVTGPFQLYFSKANQHLSCFIHPPLPTPLLYLWHERPALPFANRFTEVQVRVFEATLHKRHKEWTVPPKPGTLAVARGRGSPRARESGQEGLDLRCKGVAGAPAAAQNLIGVGGCLKRKLIQTRISSGLAAAFSYSASPSPRKSSNNWPVALPG